MSRTAKTLVAKAFGRDAEYQTAGNYSLAGVVAYGAPSPTGGEPALMTKVVAVGNSNASVARRTLAEARKIHPGLLKADQSYVMQVVPLVEATAPVVQKYFGTHNVVIHSLYKAGQPGDGMMKAGWAHPADLGMTSQWHSLKAGRALIRQLAREGFTALSFRAAGGTRIADFQVDELLKSMNARKRA